MILLSFSGFSLICATAQDNSYASEMNSRLYRGINIGNTFEAPSETAWGNPWDPDYFRIISELGFSHIRVPVRWETAERSMSDPPYTIYPLFLERIKQVIDTALKYRLHVIINMHHHDLLFDDPDGQKERFISQWEQIADYFRDYPDSLIFEVLNEPHSNLTPEKWNLFFAEALERIRVTNPGRIVLIGTAEWGGISGIRHLELPDDPNLILSVHYYNPFQFTHQGAGWVSGADAWLGTGWYDTEAERETIENEFRSAIEFSKENHIPVHVGEFGAYSRADMDSRVRWTTFVSRYIEQLGFSWAYWEFSAGFGIYDPAAGRLREELVDALLNNPMPEPAGTDVETIYSSDFENDSDGWILYTHGTASAGMASGPDGLVVSIADAGSNTWDVQLVKTGIPVTNSSMYRIAFTASSPETRSITTYTGRATSPWNAYSGYNNYTVTGDKNSFSYSFRMNDDTDINARIVFDLGNTATGFNLNELVVEKISLVSSSSGNFYDVTAGGTSLRYYPNPVSGSLYIENTGEFNKLVVYDLKGRSVYVSNVASSEIVVDMLILPAGIYFFRLTGYPGSVEFSVVKI